MSPSISIPKQPPIFPSSTSLYWNICASIEAEMKAQLSIVSFSAVLTSMERLKEMQGRRIRIFERLPEADQKAILETEKERRNVLTKGSGAACGADVQQVRV